MNEASRIVIRKILIIFGLLMLLIAVAAGVTIIVFSFKFMGGEWLTVGKYVLTIIGLAVAGFIIGLFGVLTIYLSIDQNDLKGM
jgi:hypothetical protein